MAMLDIIRKWFINGSKGRLTLSRFFPLRMKDDGQYVVWEGL
jgi:hypothetical protein